MKSTSLWKAFAGGTTIILLLSAHVISTASAAFLTKGSYKKGIQSIEKRFVRRHFSFPKEFHRPPLLTRTTRPTFHEADFTLHAAAAGVTFAAAESSSGIAASSSPSIIDSFLSSPVTWSVLVMLSIVGLLLAWETAVETARERTPPAVQSVIDRMLGEIGGLGFIGLFLSTFVLNQELGLGQAVGEVSEHFLGDEEVLLETFEFLHESFFQTGVLFFATSALMVLRVLDTIQQISKLTTDSIIESKKTSSLSGDLGGADKLADVLKSSRPSTAHTSEGANADYIPDIAMEDIESMLRIQKSDQKESPWLRELRLTVQERGAEALVIRERLLREMSLPETFRIETYLERVFTENKLDIVAISPASWVPLIPAIALANAVDLSHGVVAGAASANAALSSGYFLSTPWVFWPTAALQAASLLWGGVNFWKMSCIKSMLIPNLLLDDKDGTPKLLPPDVERPELRAAFDSTPWFVKPVEQIFSSPATNRVEELFGTVGANGPAFYLNSIKFHTWLCVSKIVVIASQILPRDIFALAHPDQVTVGDPTNLLPEVVVYGTWALLNVLQLTAAPTTFLNYCLVTCVEDMVKEDAVACSIIDDIDGVVGVEPIVSE